MNPTQNRLLAAVSAEAFEALRPHLTVRDFHQGDVLAETGSPVRDVYFPTSGIVSLVVQLKEGEMVESAMVGWDGVVNGASALNGKVALHKALFQVAGSALVISAAQLEKFADQFRDLRVLIIRHEQVLLAQSQQSGACNASHLVEARLCRWLLRTRDLAQSDDLMITQEFLGQMLGVQRSSITVVAGTLQRAGLISYRRGHVHIVDAEGLKNAACECYETIRQHYELMLMPLTKE